MWTYESALECAAEPRQVWLLYADPAGWPAWNAGVDRLELDGPFATGTHGRLTPHGQEPLPFTLVEADPDRGYISETAIADTVVMRTANTLEALPGGGTRIISRLSMHGPAAEFFGNSFGPAFAAGVPGTLKALAEKALT